MKLLSTLCLILVVGSACHGTRVPASRYQAVNRGTYAYQRLNDGECVVSAITPRDLDLALKAIGCGGQYVCLVEPRGELYLVFQRVK